MPSTDSISEWDDPLEELCGLALMMQGEEAACRLLRTAAKLAEHAAYEIARAEQAKDVSRIILIAAELERIAQARE
ncbi:DNA primase [Salipiger sp.]|uniref:DNA primase n=1 Tax=Salipiger sp. TaxID=2078585 RepID=UPI003A96D52F